MSTLWLVCDTSGSMVEGGKRLIVRGLVRQIEQFLRLGYGPETDIQIVLWDDDAAIHPWDPCDEVPAELFDCGGSASVEPLAELFSASDGAKVLMLTDGFWPDGTRQQINDWKQRLPNSTLRIIRVGADANPRLRGEDVFDSEDFFSAMEGWLEA